MLKGNAALTTNKKTTANHTRIRSSSHYFSQLATPIEKSGNIVLWDLVANIPNIEDKENVNKEIKKVAEVLTTRISEDNIKTLELSDLNILTANVQKSLKKEDLINQNNRKPLEKLCSVTQQWIQVNNPDQKSTQTDNSYCNDSCSQRHCIKSASLYPCK